MDCVHSIAQASSVDLVMVVSVSPLEVHVAGHVPITGYHALVIGFAIAGIVLFAFLLIDRLNLTVFGTLNGVIFYANIFANN